MSIDKIFNLKYNGTIPYATGDRYYVQDFVRDFRFLSDMTGLALKDMYGLIPCLISGGIVTQGAGLSLDITLGYGYARYSVEIPDSFSATPPSKISQYLEAIRINWPAKNDMNAGDSHCSVYSTTDDGATLNYVKVLFKETNGNTRTRAKATGSYSYELTVDYDFQVNSTAPNANNNELCLCTFKSNGAAYTEITPYANHQFYYKTLKSSSDDLRAMVGCVLPFAGSSAPTGWLICDGSAISRTTYDGLYIAIGTTWGTGDGSTTFNIPDQRGIFLKGAGTTSRTLGKDAAGNYYTATLGTYYQDQMFGHHHEINDGTYSIVSSGRGTGGSATLGYQVGDTGWRARLVISDGVHGTPRIGYTTEPQSSAMNFIIKY